MSLSAYPDFDITVKKEDIQRLFVNRKEYDFINKIASEFLQKIAGQFVYYLKIDRQRTEPNIYGESKAKILFAETKVPALVSEVVRLVNDEYGPRYEKDLRVAFLQELNKVYGINDIVMGDFIKWQDKTYEILNVERHKKIYGQEEFTFEIIANCKARE